MSVVEEEASEQPSKFANFESIIQETGWGIYYRYLVAIACLTTYCHAIQMLAIPLGVPYSTCDTIMSVQTIVTMYVSYYLGKSFGGFLVNSIADYYGRKKVIIFCMIMNFLGLFTCAFTQSGVFNVLALFILGSCLEGLMCISKILLAELLTANKRRFYLVLTDICWTLGYITITFCSMFSITQGNSEKQGIDMRLGLWRMVFAIAGSFSLFLGCFAALMEESPRFLLFSKKHYITLVMLKQYFTLNTSLYGDVLEIKENDINDIIHDYQQYYPLEYSVFTDHVKHVTMKSFKGIRFILKKHYWKTTCLLVYMNITIFFGMFNTHVLLYRTLHVPNSNGAYRGILDLHIIRPKNEQCIFSVDYGAFMNFLWLSGLILAGKVLLLLLIRKSGKFILFGTCNVCAIAFLLRALINDDHAYFPLSIFILLTYGMIDSMLYIKTIELYPTAVRGLSFGFTRLFSVLFTIVFIPDRNEPLSYLLIINAVLLFGGSLGSLFLQDLTGEPMVE